VTLALWLAIGLLAWLYGVLALGLAERLLGLPGPRLPAAIVALTGLVWLCHRARAAGVPAPVD
jgi:hypothetical protein